MIKGIAPKNDKYVKRNINIVYTNESSQKRRRAEKCIKILVQRFRKTEKIENDRDTRSKMSWKDNSVFVLQTVSTL